MTTLVLSHGGSTDGSLEVIEDFKEQLDWWVSEPDNGQSHAINKGMARASGEVLAWLNSDDQYEPEALTTVARTFRRRPDAVMVYGDYTTFDNEGNEDLKRRIAFDWGICARAFMMTPQPSTFFSRWGWSRVGGLDEDLHFCTDYDVILRLARLGPVVQVKKSLSRFRIHEESKTASEAKVTAAEYLRVREMALGRPLRPLDKLWERLFTARAGFRMLTQRGVIVLPARFPPYRSIVLGR